ncbi:uncharacterized protein LOC112567249 [Pomacea canaliculata]|uniref:uncharacterized protein LOC112567249 n=1 Tax=Pomacea canaliculata TaxID=400727 RepID=UPI000D734327|nr:uncharacterized protein LOC112567249 [Pomacea canaliculata]
MKIVILFCLLPAVLGYNSNYSRPNYPALLDTNGDGKLRQSDVKSFFDLKDSNGDGFITLEEYSAAEPPGTSPIQLKARFDFFDHIDGNVDKKFSQQKYLLILQLLGVNSEYGFYTKTLQSVWTFYTVFYTQKAQNFNIALKWF